MKMKLDRVLPSTQQHSHQTAPITAINSDAASD